LSFLGGDLRTCSGIAVPSTGTLLNVMSQEHMLWR